MAIKRYEMPCGTLYVNEDESPRNFYVKGELIKLLPKQSKFVGGSQQDLVHYLLYPGFWESRKVFDEMKKKNEHIEVVLDATQTDRWGDTILLTLIPKAYKESYEAGIDVDVLTHPKTKTIWEHCPHVRDVYLEEPEGKKYALTVDLNKVELKFRASSKTKCSDIVLQKVGLYTVNKTPSYVVTEDERKQAKEAKAAMVPEGNKLVGVAYESAAKVREYPHMKNVADMLSREPNTSVIQLDCRDADGSYRFTFEQMAALIEQCDMVLANDSGVLHLAGALKRRVVGVFGHTDGRILTENYEHSISVQGKKCALKRQPCWWDTPCLGTKTYQEAEPLGPPECLTALEPVEVVEHIRAATAKRKKLFVVMLTYNLIAWTKVALESIRSFHDYEVMVVDNESTDGTQDYLKAKGISYVSKRCGVAAAQNIAFREFLKSDADYVILLNNDIVLHYDTIDSLIRTLDADPALVAVTSTEVPNVAPWLVDTAPQGKGLTDIVDIGPGAYSCTAFRRSIVEKIGLFDEHFTPRYIEDNDYTLRLRLAGGKFAKSAESIYYHVLGAVVNTIAEEKKHRDKHWVKNIAYYIEKWGIHPHAPQDIAKLGAEHRMGEFAKRIDTAIVTKGKAHVVVVRNMGGWGDVLFSTVIARELKRKYDSAITINYVVPDKYAALIARYPYIDKSKSGMPDALLDITDTEFRHEWHEVAEHGSIQSSRTEFYLNLAGLPNADLKPDYFVTDEERAWAVKRWDAMSGKGRVVLVKTGSNKLKNWHGMDELECQLVDYGLKVIVSEKAAVSMEQLAALISEADLVISPDTGPSNVAGALGVPVLTLFSNRNGAVFGNMFPSMIPVQGKCPHGIGYCDYRLPCSGTEGPYRPKENALGEPDCFKALTVDDVMAVVKELI
jgi:ADP-heptose:LPS heptosyltransferase/GT2 family glycosyltransferase